MCLRVSGNTSQRRPQFGSFFHLLAGHKRRQDTDANSTVGGDEVGMRSQGKTILRTSGQILAKFRPHHGRDCQVRS